MKLGFIGLGNVGAKLAGSLLRNGVDLTVRDLDPDRVAEFVADGAKSADSPAAMMAACDAVITCLPSPAASAHVMEAVHHRRGRGQTPRRAGHVQRRRGR